MLHYEHTIVATVAIAEVLLKWPITRREVSVVVRGVVCV